MLSAQLSYAIYCRCVIFQQTSYTLEMGTARFSDGNQRTSYSDQLPWKGQSEISKKFEKV